MSGNAVAVSCHIAGCVILLFYVFDFVGNLVGEAFKLRSLDAGHVREDEVFDCFAGLATFLGSKKECCRCANECAAESCCYEGKCFLVLGGGLNGFIIRY